MITKIIDGDLIAEFQAGKYDGIVHGCNCFNTMGAGIAFTIKQKFPQAYDADLKTIKGDVNKLGTYTLGYVGSYFIVNAYTQFKYSSRTKETLADYDAIRKVFQKLNDDFRGKRFGIPKIGAGLALGDWQKIEQIINEVTPDIDIELVQYVQHK